MTALVLILSAAPLSFVSAATVFTDSFEAPTNLGNWTSGSAWNSDSSDDHSGSKSARVAGSNSGQTMSRTVSTTGYNTIVVSFWYKAESLDDDSGTSNDDHLYAEYSTNNGSSWNELSDISDVSGDDDDDGNWHESSDSIAAASNIANFQVRFRGVLNNGSDKVWIDDVLITGTAIPTDSDSDGVVDGSDNCPSTSNANQANNDGDSQGDVCDTDDDNDTVVDTTDNCDFNANTNQLDSDNDGLGDVCDGTPFTDEQLCEQQEGMSWNGTNCVEDVAPTCGEGFTGIYPVCIPVFTCPEGTVGIFPLCEEITPEVCPLGWSGTYPDCIEPEGETDLCPEEGIQTEENLPCADIEENTPNETPGEGSGGSTEPSSLCTDGIDNDEDGLMDWPLDPGCTYPYTNDETDPSVPSLQNDENGIGGSVEEGTLASETLEGGACVAPLTSYIGMGNDIPEDVKFLQSFLNTEMKSTLEIDGIFGASTRDVVKSFQVKYAEEVLAPWAPFGIKTTEGTGIVYKTTQRMINMIACPGTDIPMPLLP